MALSEEVYTATSIKGHEVLGFVGQRRTHNSVIHTVIMYIPASDQVSHWRPLLDIFRSFNIHSYTVLPSFDVKIRLQLFARSFTFIGLVMHFCKWG